METLNQLLSIDLNYITIALIAVFFTMELIFSSRKTYPKTFTHFFNNVLFFCVFFLFNLAWATVLVFSIEWLNRQEVGLFYLVTVPLIIAGVKINLDYYHH